MTNCQVPCAIPLMKVNVNRVEFSHRKVTCSKLKKKKILIHPSKIKSQFNIEMQRVVHIHDYVYSEMYIFLMVTYHLINK